MMLLNTSILLYANSVPERRVNQHAQSWEFLLKNRRESEEFLRRKGEKVFIFVALQRISDAGFFYNEKLHIRVIISLLKIYIHSVCNVSV